MLRPATPADAAPIADIYNHYVRDTVVTFEEEPVSVQEMEGRIRDILAGFPWLVAVEDGAVVGYSYAGTFKSRCAYRLTVESTVYLAPGAVRRGLGSALYSALLAELRARRFHAVIGGIALPNPASVALHEKFGFKKVSEFKEIGWKFGRWIDVGHWQLTLP